jgi:hypothetical protein
MYDSLVHSNVFENSISWRIIYTVVLSSLSLLQLSVVLSDVQPNTGLISKKVKRDFLSITKSIAPYQSPNEFTILIQRWIIVFFSLITFFETSEIGQR